MKRKVAVVVFAVLVVLALAIPAGAAVQDSSARQSLLQRIGPQLHLTQRTICPDGSAGSCPPFSPYGPTLVARFGPPLPWYCADAFSCNSLPNT